jgi:predicted AAA+ superfamily ATPase
MSGSNSKLLSSELSTHFRGRVFEYKVYPLTHREILSFAGLAVQKYYATEDLARIKHLYHTVFTYGSFPEVILAKDEFSQKEVVKGYFNVLFFRDIMERFRVDNEYAMQYLLKSLTLSFTKDINIHKIFNDLKSQNIKLSITTLYEYFEHLKSAFYGYELEDFFTVLRGRKKFYLYNLGFHALFSPSPDFGQSFENVLFLELKKRFNRVFFKK